MGIVLNFVFIFLFVLICIKQIKDIRTIKINTRRSALENIIYLVIVFGFIIFTYLKADKIIDYIFSTGAILVLITTYLREGISDDGFLSTYRYNVFIKWEKIHKVIVTKKKHTKLRIEGDFMEQSFSFRNEDYDRVMAMLTEKLPYDAEIVIK